MDKFEQKEMKKIRPIKINWLINYISDPIRKNVSGFKDKTVRLFSTPKQIVYRRGKKLSKPKKKNLKKTKLIALETFLY